MKLINSLSAPVYVKLTDDFAWPSDSMFYLLTGDGVFLCRNHPFFKSSVKVKGPVKEMPSHEEFVIPSYPFISALHMKRVVGWFHAVAKKHSSEAIVLLCWNALEKRLEIVCPHQEVIAMQVTYTIPDMPAGWTIIGDIHSHVDMPAYSSFTDEKDEKYRAGLHIVVGKIYDKRPDFFCNAVVDGQSFTIEEHEKIFDYEKLSAWPAHWMNQLTVKEPSWQFWKGKSKYSDKEYNDEGFKEGGTVSTYNPTARLIKLEDLKSRLAGDVDLPGGMVLMSPTATELALIKLYADAAKSGAELVREAREEWDEQTNS